MRIKVDAIGQTMGSGRFTGCNEEAVFSLTKRLKEKKKKNKDKHEGFHLFLLDCLRGLLLADNGANELTEILKKSDCLVTLT